MGLMTQNPAPLRCAVAVTNEATQVYEIRKYPNRRFYDVSRSRHVTLDDLYELVKAGHQIIVTDSKSGADISNIVLTQIILEHDPPKLDLFPASLLHQAIQANEQMVRKFVDEYFAQAVQAFSQSRHSFDAFLQKSGFSALQPMAPFDWVRMLFPTMGREEGIKGSRDQGTVSESGNPSGGVDALRQEMESMRAELAELREKPGKKPSKPRRK
jgi:polyhydroxyalkanoate synthesis repressor PhaR